MFEVVVFGGLILALVLFIYKISLDIGNA